MNYANCFPGCFTILRVRGYVRGFYDFPLCMFVCKGFIKFYTPATQSGVVLCGAAQY